MTPRGARIGAALFFLAAALAVAAILVHGYRKQEEWRREQRAYYALSGEQGDLSVREVVPRWEANARVERCTTCHLGASSRAPLDGGALDAGAPKNLRPHPGSLLASHAVERFGCVVCHGGRGDETTLAAHDGIFRPRSRAPLASELDARRDRASLVAAISTTESACLACHASGADLGDEAPVAARGRALFRDRSCAGCHAGAGVDAKRDAAPLDDLAASHRPEYVLSFLRDPRAWHPGTAMPSFWPAPVDSTTLRPTAPDDAWRARMRTETLAIASFLVERAESRKRAEAFDRATVIAGASADEGRVFVEAYGCVACHAREGSPAARAVGPTFAGAGLRLRPDFVAYYVESPQRWWKQAKMPSLRLTRREAASIALYLDRERAQPSGAAPVDKDEIEALSSPAKRAERVVCNLPSSGQMSRAQCGEALVVSYGCAGCHALEGHADDAPIGPSLDAWADKRAVQLVDFGRVPSDEHDRTRELFVAWKLAAPRAFEHKGAPNRMPDFGLDVSEIAALATYVMGRRSIKPLPAFDADADSKRRDRARDAELVASLACGKCHAIDPSDRAALAGPSLVGEGARVQPEWLFRFVRDPGASGVRPASHPEWIYGDQTPLAKLPLRMPTYALTDEQATSLARFFATRAGAPFPFEAPVVQALAPDDRVATAAFVQRACMTCHYAGELPAERAKTELAKLAPNLADARTRLRPEWVKALLVAPEKGSGHAAVDAKRAEAVVGWMFGGK